MIAERAETWAVACRRCGAAPDRGLHKAHDDLPDRLAVEGRLVAAGWRVDDAGRGESEATCPRCAASSSSSSSSAAAA